MFGLTLVCIAVVNALVPILSLGMIRDAATKSGLNFGAEYGAYRQYGSLGFMSGLLACGLFTDWLSPKAIPVLLAFGGLVCAFYLKEAKPKEPELSTDQTGYLATRISLLPFFFLQLFVWSGFCIFFRYLPIRMREMGASSLEISITAVLLGLINIVCIKQTGHISERYSFRFLALIVLTFTALRIGLISVPSKSYLGFYLVQILHIPTWILNDIISIRYMKDKQKTLGALNISVMNQASLTFGMVLGSYFMSEILIISDLKNSFIYAAILPFFALPFLFSKHIKA